MSVFLCGNYVEICVRENRLIIVLGPILIEFHISIPLAAAAAFASWKNILKKKTDLFLEKHKKRTHLLEIL